MKQLNKKTGRLAEDMAARALEDKGYHILERNFANKFGEIDIIAKDGETVVFVEVKAKTGVEMGNPEEMINKGKLQKIRNVASIYLKDQRVPCRLDVVAVVLTEGQTLKRLTHYQNVYL